MNAYFREITPGLRMSSKVAPRAVGDLQDHVDARYKLCAQIEDIIYAIREAAREDQDLLNHGGHVDGTHAGVAGQDVDKLSKALEALS